MKNIKLKIAVVFLLLACAGSASAWSKWSWDDMRSFLARANSWLAAQTITTTTSPQLTVGYDTSNKVTVAVSSGGDATIAPSGLDTIFTGTLTAGTAAFTSATTPLTLKYNGSNTVPFSVSSSGDMTVAPSGLDTIFTGTLTSGTAAFTSTTTPLTLKYDGSNTFAVSVSSSGDVTMTPSGGDFTMAGNIAASGTATFLRDHITFTSTTTLTTAQCSGTVLDNVGLATAMTLTLPTASEGMRFVWRDVVGSHTVDIKAGASDKIYLNGTALDDADKVRNNGTSAAVCDSVTVESMQTAAGVYDWAVEIVRGTFTDGGA